MPRRIIDQDGTGQNGAGQNGAGQNGAGQSGDGQSGDDLNGDGPSRAGRTPRPVRTLAAGDAAALARAMALLDGGGGRLARGAASLARLAGLAATPVSRAVGLAFGVRRRLGGPSSLAPVIAQMLERALDIATLALPFDAPASAIPPASMRGSEAEPGARRRAAWHHSATGHAARGRAAAIASGLAGGAAGLPGFLPDAAFTTLLMLRGIAAIAAREGEDLATPEARAACIEVFTLGAPLSPAARFSRTRFTQGGTALASIADSDDAPGAAVAAAGAEHDSYWTARLLMQGVPLMALIRQAAARLGVALSEKLALQAVPLAGAAGGALVNAAFYDHYRALAEGHFIIRRLERAYGRETVRLAAMR